MYEMPNLTVQVRTFLRFYGRETVQQVENRDISSLSLPEECEFYFFDSYVGIINGTEYIFGPEVNVSPTYYKGNEYYPNPEHFRVYFMRAHEWPESKIFDDFGPSSLAYPGFGFYNEKEYPNGVLIVNQIITNPKDGIILSVKKTIKEFIQPSEETIKAYRSDF